MRILTNCFNYDNRILAAIFACTLCAGPVSQAQAGGGLPAFDIDFEFQSFSASGTGALPLGPNAQLVQTKVTFELNTASPSLGNTLLQDGGDNDGILELGENAFVDSFFDIFYDISFEDVDSGADFAVASSLLTYSSIGFSMSDSPFVPQCPVSPGAFGGCGMLMAANSTGDDYDGFISNPFGLGFDVTGDLVDDSVTTTLIDTSFFGANTTNIVGGNVFQTYDVAMSWAASINPDFQLDLTGTAEVFTSSAPGTVVPVPAAAWLFASGLIGLAGIGRRKVV